ncbi:serine hydrolase [Gordonia sp. CPCC 205333]|uniref:D-alanyl-D-alanine carboxypeptidase n=1 Tax=Gordonia sp. CPCC 205333 TaxID=3140790 RepID=UPI003AF38C5A
MRYVTRRPDGGTAIAVAARFVVVATLVAVFGLLTVPATPGHASPVPTDHCPHKVSTPPAVDESEVPKPGDTVPTPLPVHSPTIGGDRLAHCGMATSSPAPQLAAMAPAGWLIADLDSGKVLAAKDAHGRYRPASTIKVLLALVALDELDLEKTVSVTAEDYSTEGDSCGTGPRGHYTNRQLLTGLVMVSGNDCASALARELGGTEATLTKMNDKAKSLQAYDTRAASPSGLDAPGMSTSAYDLALIFRAAMRNETFRELIALPTYRFPGYPRDPSIPGDKDHPSYLMQTSCSLLLNGYPGMLGGKTGFTDDARKTFVGAAQRDGRRVVIVQMYGLNTKTSNDYWDQAKLMFDHGFATSESDAVGTLVEPANSATEQTTTVAADPENAAHRTTSGTNESGNWSKRVLIGLVAALIAVLLAAAGLSINKR